MGIDSVIEPACRRDKLWGTSWTKP